MRGAPEHHSDFGGLSGTVHQPQPEEPHQTSLDRKIAAAKRRAELERQQTPPDQPRMSTEQFEKDDHQVDGGILPATDAGIPPCWVGVDPASGPDQTIVRLVAHSPADRRADDDAIEQAKLDARIYGTGWVRFRADSMLAERIDPRAIHADTRFCDPEPSGGMLSIHADEIPDGMSPAAAARHLNDLKNQRMRSILRLMELNTSPRLMIDPAALPLDERTLAEIAATPMKMIRMVDIDVSDPARANYERSKVQAAQIAQALDDEGDRP